MAKGEKGKKPVVFCDFDGTITAEESLQAVFEHFLPDKWSKMKDQLMSGEVTLRSGVREMLESIPSDRYPATLKFVSEIPLRSGFTEFLDFLEAHQIPFVIVSGGVRGMVEISLGNLLHRVQRVVAVDVDDSGEFLKVHSEFEGGTELVAKVDVMEQFEAEPRIVIGDGITDLNMAQNADLVFARGRLAHYLEDIGASYLRWGDFMDVRRQLRDWLF